MNIKENTPSPSVLELTIELERADIESDLQKTAKTISKNIEIAGFRKGNAPYNDVCRHIGGEAKIYEESLQRIVSRTLEKIIADKKLDLFGQPKIDIQKMVPPFGISYKAAISLTPLVELGDISKIKEKPREALVAEEDVEKVINNLREMRVAESAVKREIKKGDKAVLDFEVKRDNVIIENGQARDYPLVIGEGKFIPGFEEQVIGLSAGEKKKFELEFPKQYHEKSLAGKKAEFNVAIKQVFERVLPDFDDEFAKGLGHTETSKELRSQIMENLKLEREREEAERYQVACVEELVKLSKVGPVSEDAIQQETHSMLHELEQSVSQQGIKFDEYLKNIKKSREDLEKEFKPKAEHRLKVMLVAREFGKRENVKVEDKELNEEIEISKKAYANQPEMLSRIESLEYRQYVRNALVSRKIFEAIARQAGKK